MRNIIYAFIIALVGFIQKPAEKFTMECSTFIEVKKIRFTEGKNFDGLLFRGDNGTTVELFHPVKVKTKDRRIEMTDPFGTEFKVGIGKIEGYTNIPSILNAIMDCKENSQNVLTSSLLAEINSQVGGSSQDSIFKYSYDEKFTGQYDEVGDSIFVKGFPWELSDVVFINSALRLQYPWAFSSFKDIKEIEISFNYTAAGSDIKFRSDNYGFETVSDVIYVTLLSGSNYTRRKAFIWYTKI